MTYRRRSATFGTLQSLLLLISLVCGLGTNASAADLEREPIHYSKAPENNVISRLQKQIENGKATLAYDDKHGYLPAILQELKVPVSSQVLVFSKTSFQRQRISPRTPRALYFNEKSYVGYCQAGNVLEVSAVDPQLGTVFYAMEQKKTDKPRLTRQNDSCMICHASSQNQGFPGHLVRSVFSDGDGQPILSRGTTFVDQSSPLEKRWGGWYVTGKHGKQMHLGNLTINEKDPTEKIDNAAGMNVMDLGRYFKTKAYLSPHSDIVALMVLEHQVEMQNRIARAGFLTRVALFDEAVINKMMEKPAGTRSESTTHRIQYACEPLVKYMLFSGEVKLTDPIEGTSSFARDFVQPGPRDSRNRSLRDLDLKTRLFCYPCSYLIYSEAFDALPVEARDEVLRRLWDVLSGKDASKEFAHLSTDDRRAILEIIRDTKGDLPDYWKK